MEEYKGYTFYDVNQFCPTNDISSWQPIMEVEDYEFNVQLFLKEFFSFAI